MRRSNRDTAAVGAAVVLPRAARTRSAEKPLSPPAPATAEGAPRPSGGYRDRIPGQILDVTMGGALTLTVPAGAAVALLPS